MSLSGSGTYSRCVNYCGTDCFTQFQESMHEYHEVAKKVMEDQKLETHPGGEACEEETLFSNVVRVLEPVFFPFAIEFVLIGELEQNLKRE